MMWIVSLLSIAAVVVTIIPRAWSSEVVSRDPNYLDRGEFGVFLRSLNVKPYGYTVIVDPTGNAPSRLIERFEVRPGDCHFSGGWSDCRSDRERSELWEQGKRSPHGSEARYR